MSERLYPAILPGRSSACCSAYVSRNRITYSVKAYDSVCLGFLLVFPCTLGLSPFSFKFFKRFLNLLMPMPWRNRNIEVSCLGVRSKCKPSVAQPLDVVLLWIPRCWCLWRPSTDQVWPYQAQYSSAQHMTPSLMSYTPWRTACYTA